MRGMGRVFKRKNSMHWWIEYWDRGRQYWSCPGLVEGSPLSGSYQG
jgi:hypothetical protein